MDSQDFIKVYESKILINATLKAGSSGQLALMRTNYFMDKLDTLDGYNGFFPRVLLPTVKMYKGDSFWDTNSTEYEDFTT